MSTTLDPAAGIEALPAAAELSDAAWLKSLPFRASAPAALVAAAAQGEEAEFALQLQAALRRAVPVSKREREQLLETLERLWRFAVPGLEEGVDAASLAHCLFDRDLNQDELSGRVEAILASRIDGTGDLPTLLAAAGIVHLLPQRLEPRTLLTLWRWALTARGALTCDPQQGFSAFDVLEYQLLAVRCFDFLKGQRKLARESARALRAALDAATDEDGTPQARWLTDLLPRLAQIGRINLLARPEGTSPWDRKSRKRIVGLLERSAPLLTPAGLAFSTVDAGQAAGILSIVADLSELPVAPQLRQLWHDWAAAAVRSIRPPRRRVLRKTPRECHQSDWADWAVLRSTWSAPVDAVAIRYDQTLPAIDAVGADRRFLSGAWAHELTLDGVPVPVQGEWSCCCWFADKDAAYVELQLDRENPVQIIRQALLLRQESVLLLADSIRTPQARQIEWSRSVPLADGWTTEADSTTRELALVCGKKRVRLFPWSSPQGRIDRSAETTSVQGQQLTVRTTASAPRLYAATLFDWSPRRKGDPVDWQRLTVCEDGRMVPPEDAVGFRLRIGRKHWLLYHSLLKPAIPRTVLGLHTASETVLARLDPDGDLKTLLEVEL